VGFQLGELALMKCRKTLKKELAGYKAEYSVAKELELLVVQFFRGTLPAPGFGLLVSMGAVSKSALQQHLLSKGMSKHGL
jgi:hypothetical protein